MRPQPAPSAHAACSEHVRSLLGTGTEQATNKPIVSFKCSRCYVVDFAPYGRTGSLPGKVIYTNYKTLMAEADEKLVSSLAVK